MRRCRSWVACLAMAGPAQAVEWFPATPGTPDSVYLLFEDPCRDGAPVARPRLVRMEDRGAWRFEIAGRATTACASGPAAIHAFEVPAEIEGQDVVRVEVVERRIDADAEATTETRVLVRPTPRPMPAAIAGYWRLDSARFQGLMLSMDDRGRVAAIFHAFDAAGRPAWATAVAATDDDTLTLRLQEVPSGRFAGVALDDVEPRRWGELDLVYARCGELHAAWRPEPRTGLAPDTGTFRQVSSAHGTACDLWQRAAVLGGEPVLGDYEIVARPNENG